MASPLPTPLVWEARSGEEQGALRPVRNWRLPLAWLRRVFNDHFIALLAKDDSDRWCIIHVLQLGINCGQVEIHFARELGFELFDLRSITTKQRSRR